MLYLLAGCINLSGLTLVGLKCIKAYNLTHSCSMDVA